MKFSFKRFLSSALAAVMTASVLSVGMVSSVSAAPQVYDFGSADIAAALKSFNFKTGGEIVKGLSYFGSSSSYSANYIDDTTKGPGLQFGGSSNHSRRMLYLTADADETITVKFKGPKEDATSKGFCVITNNVEGMVTSYTGSDYLWASGETSGYTEGTVSIDSKAKGTTFYIGAPDSNAKTTITYIEVTSKKPAGTGSITGTVKGFDPSAAPKGKFYCNDAEFTVDPASGSYTISGLADGQYTLKYEGYDYSMVEQIVTVSGGKATTQDLTLTKLETVTVSGTIVSTDNTGIPASAKIAISYGSGKTGESSITFPKQGDPTFSIEGVLADSGSATLSITGADDYTLSGDTSINIAKADVTAALKLSYSKDTVEVLPDADGKYDFTNATGTLLTFDPKDPQSAYSKFNAGGSADVNYVSLSSAGAKLEDNSSATTSLVVPCKATSGTVTISGSVTPTAALGSKWKLVDFGVIAISTDGADSSTALTFTTNNQVAKDPASPDLGNIAKDKKITYTVTIDLDNHKASANIINENGNKTAEFKDVPFEGDSISHVTFATNGNGSADKARALLIPDITIKGAEEPKPVTVGSTVEGGKTYVFAGVAEDHTGDADTLVVYGSSKDTTAEDIKTNGKELFTTDTVYDSVQDVPTPGTVQGKVFAHEVKVDTVTSKTINIVAYLGNVASDVASVTVSK